MPGEAKMRDLFGIMAVASGLLIAGPASAQKAAPQSPLMGELARCKAQTDQMARLRCYDVAAAALDDASKRGDVIVVNREDVRETRRSLFGFNLPKLPFFGGDDSQDDEAEEIDLTIRSFQTLDYDRYVIEFDDGSRWQTTEARPVKPRAGEKVTIKKASLGGYFLRVGGRFVRGMRTK
jgi:hypothetical protein